jgi:hypothetical protein
MIFLIAFYIYRIFYRVVAFISVGINVVLVINVVTIINVVHFLFEFSGSSSDRSCCCYFCSKFSFGL